MNIFIVFIDKNQQSMVQTKSKTKGETMNRLKLINKLLEEGLSYKTIAEQTGVNEEIIRQIDESEEFIGTEPTEMFGEYINTTTEETIKRLYDVVSIEKEWDILHPSIREKALYILGTDVYLDSDKIEPRISQNGFVYFTIGKHSIKGYNLNIAIRNKFAEAQLRKIKIISKEPKYEIWLYKSISDKEYLVWIDKRTNQVNKIYTKQGGLNKLENELESIEYKALKEELDYVHNIEKEPTCVEEEEVYKEPETFIERTAELKELLGEVLRLRTSGRKLSAEEFELLREIQSEIEILIG